MHGANESEISMPPRPKGLCRHCGNSGWIVGRGLCRKCYSTTAIRNRYLTFRPKRRALRGATYSRCSVCGRWRYISGRERCQSCYRQYGSITNKNFEADPGRLTRIQDYTRLASRGQPLFDGFRVSGESGLSSRERRFSTESTR